MNLQKLISLRDGHKKLINHHLEKIWDAKENGRLREFNAILAVLEEKVKLLDGLNDKVLHQTEADSIEEEMMAAGDYSLNLEIQMSELREFRSRGEQSSSFEGGATPPTPTPTSSQSTSSDHANGIPLHQRIQTVSDLSFNSSNSSQFHRLPKLSFPTFDGDILKWQSFWDTFESTIHFNSSLTDVQKFNYLKCQTEGEAARTIEGFALTNANYAKALELLKERFGQKHKIISCTMQALLNIPAPSNTLHSLRQFYDRTENHIRSLESLGQCQESYGSLLVPIIIEKLPSEIRQHLARDHGDNNWILQDLRHALNREINIIDAGVKTTNPDTDYRDYQPTASFHTGTRRNMQPPRPDTRIQRNQQHDVKCAFCSEIHTSNSCMKYPDVETRLNIVKRKQLCFNCLGTHSVAQCKSKKRCQKCHKKHHTSICRVESQSPHIATTSAAEPETAVFHSTTKKTDTSVLLKTAISTVCYRDIHAEAHILFDEGAQRSFITQDLADELQLIKGEKEAVYLSAFGSTGSKVQYLERATVNLKTDAGKYIPLHVLVVPTIASPVCTRSLHKVTELPYLRGIKLAHPVSGEDIFCISLLIGADHYWDVIENHIIRGDGPTAVKSKIGYLLSGPMSNASKKNSSKHILNVITSRNPIESTLERFWTLESMGVNPETVSETKKDELRHYQQTAIEYTDGKYTAKLPWKDDHPPLPDNYDVTKRRTESTIRRLRKDPTLLKTYGDIIADQERRGFIERVPDNQSTSCKVHYIPHHPVQKRSSTTPVRIVFDCSCHQSYNHPSLNDCLQSTPPVINDLSTLLVRFRMKKYAVTADIEKAFLHVGLHPSDRDVTRFLWLSDPSNPDSPFTTYRFKSVLFGATCSPFILNATLLKHVQQNRTTPAAQILERDLYVDNIVSSFDNEQELTQYYTEARDLICKAGMNLRSWASNSGQLREKAALDSVLDTDEITKVLGMHWEPQTDVMSFTHREIPELPFATKREVLRYSSEIYDPLGLLSPVTVRAKLLMQELWKLNHDWDTPLPCILQQTWTSLVQDLNTVTKLKYPRQVVPNSQTGTIDLHIFVDASCKSYGAAAYVTKGKESNLIMAKNRVAPLKKITLPRLELMAALLGARLATHLEQSLKPNNIHYWSDCQIVLHWLATTRPLKQFERNRVTEIKNLSKLRTWKYCPTECNPADLLTRGISAQQLSENKLWNNGPEWLNLPSTWSRWERATVFSNYEQ